MHPTFAAHLMLLELNSSIDIRLEVLDRRIYQDDLSIIHSFYAVGTRNSYELPTEGDLKG
jgi:hypothetical protein